MVLVLDTFTPNFWFGNYRIFHNPLHSVIVDTCILRIKMKKLFILVCAIFLVSCNPVVHNKRYDEVLVQGSAVILSKDYVQREHPDDMYRSNGNIYVKNHKEEWTHVITPRIEYSFWFYISYRGDTMWISVPYEVYDKLNIGDTLKL